MVRTAVATLKSRLNTERFVPSIAWSSSMPTKHPHGMNRQVPGPRLF